MHDSLSALGVGFVEQLHRLPRARAPPRAPHTSADLHDATGVACRSELGVSGRDVTQFGREHGVGCIGLYEIVDPRCAAAVFRPLEWHEPERRNGAEYGEWRIDDPLRMKKMTWRIVRDS